MLKLTKGHTPLNAEEATQALISASIASMTEGWNEEQSEAAVGAAMDGFCEYLKGTYTPDFDDEAYTMVRDDTFENIDPYDLDKVEAKFKEKSATFRSILEWMD